MTLEGESKITCKTKGKTAENKKKKLKKENPEKEMSFNQLSFI